MNYKTPESQCPQMFALLRIKMLFHAKKPRRAINIDCLDSIIELKFLSHITQKGINI